MKYLFVIIIIALMLISGGCQGTFTPNSIDNTETIKLLSSSITESIDMLDDLNDDDSAIIEQIQGLDGISLNNDKALPKINHLQNNNILEKAQISELKSDIKSILKILTVQEETIISLEEIIVSKDKQIRDLQESNLKSVLKWLNWTGALLIPIGIMLIFFRQFFFGLPLIMTGFSTIAASYLLTNYVWVFALVGGILLIAALVWFIYSSATKDKVIEETVGTVELMKDSVDKQEYEEIVKDEIDKKQSSRTKKFVKKIRKKITDK